MDFILWGWAVTYRAGNTQACMCIPTPCQRRLLCHRAAATLEPGDAGKISFYDPGRAPP
jgi:hypothetical protein